MIRSDEQKNAEIHYTEPELEGKLCYAFYNMMLSASIL